MPSCCNTVGTEYWRVEWGPTWTFYTRTHTHTPYYSPGHSDYYNIVQTADETFYRDLLINVNKNNNNV